jgi:hypothetical protein
MEWYYVVGAHRSKKKVQRSDRHPSLEMSTSREIGSGSMVRQAHAGRGWMKQENDDQQWWWRGANEQRAGCKNFHRVKIIVHCLNSKIPTMAVLLSQLCC